MPHAPKAKTTNTTLAKKVRIHMNWEDILRKCIGGELHGKKLKDAVCKLALGSAVYNIWRYIAMM